MKHLAITLPNGSSINPPGEVPTGGLTTIGTVVGNVLNIMLIIVIIIALISLVWSGIQWSTSAGDKNKIESAKKRITWALIGLIIGLCVFFILNIIGYLFGGVNLLDFSFQ